jgi:D-3-phosphoglycerate dehydrogenase
LNALPNIKIISKWGVGCETVEFDAVRRHDVRFGFQPGVNKLAVAELTLCFMLSALRWITPLNQSMRAGERPGMRNGRGLTGRVVGLHGCGNVGKEVVRLLAPFECEILVHDVADYPAFYERYGITPVSFPELLAHSEVLSLHIPLTDATANLYDADVLEKLQPDCVLINTCRGGIVDEAALAERLRSDALVAACSDVFAIEPAANDELLQLTNFLATPHIGASTDSARLAMGRAAIEGLTKNEIVPPGVTY